MEKFIALMEQLIISNKIISFTAVQCDISQLLSSLIDILESAKVCKLSLSHCHFADNICYTLSLLSNLNSLDISYAKQISSSNLAMLLHEFRNRNTITDLDISGLLFDPNIVEVLSDWILLPNCSLNNLYIRKCGICDYINGGMIFDAFQYNNSLIQIDLSYNNISSISIEYILQLVHSKSIRKLILDDIQMTHEVNNLFYYVIFTITIFKLCIHHTHAILILYHICR
jgi:hypothetical protein